MHTDSDDHLVRYLLGELPDDETERLDECSITDDDFALRLRVLENDLIDRYASGQPSDDLLERFDRRYRASAYLRGKVRFARALSQLAANAEPRTRLAQSAPAAGWLGSWMLAAATLILIAAGYLGVRNLSLRDEVANLESRSAGVEQRNAELRRELDQMRATPAPQLSASIATFLLPAPRRGLSADATTVTVPRAADRVALRLQVEAEDYERFWVAVSDPASTRVVWRSGDLPAERSADNRIVTVTVPNVLASQRYSVDLTGIPARGSPELIGQYPIRVVLE